jgi:hypothetical protein
MLKPGDAHEIVGALLLLSREIVSIRGCLFDDMVDVVRRSGIVGTPVPARE